MKVRLRIDVTFPGMIVDIFCYRCGSVWVHHAPYILRCLFWVAYDYSLATDRY